MIDFIIALLRSSTPIAYVAMAGMIAQRAGVWNLGLEGLMIIGACATIVGIILTGSFPIALLIAVCACVMASVLLWFVIEHLKANPIIAGLGLTGLRLGGTSLAVQAIFGSQAAINAPFGVPRLGTVFGPFGVLSVFVLLAPFVVFALWVLLKRTRFGLRLAATGEHPLAARSVGVNPTNMRLVALMIGGVLCAIGGAELAAGSLQFFGASMTAGKGFMAFAAVVLGAAHPVGTALAALFFSTVEALGIVFQLNYGSLVPSSLLQTLPYVATILGVWLSSHLRGGAKAMSNGFAELKDN